MNQRRGMQLLRTIGLTGCLMLLGALSPELGRAASAKVDVCHRALSGSFNLITIAYQAVNAHRAHGDALPGEDVPGAPGLKFDATCAQVRASSCPCNFSLQGLAQVGIDGSGPMSCNRASTLLDSTVINIEQLIALVAGGTVTNSAAVGTAAGSPVCVRQNALPPGFTQEVFLTRPRIRTAWLT